MGSRIRYLKNNRQRTTIAIANKRFIEAWSGISKNVCFSFVTFGGIDQVDHALLLEVTEKVDLRKIQKRLDSDIAYAKRIDARSETSLDALEVDLLYSLVTGVLESIIALRIAGVDEVINQTEIDWLKEIVLTRGDMAGSESRMRKMNPLYLNLEVLLNTYSSELKLPSG